jgi:hypothetical protein
MRRLWPRPRIFAQIDEYGADRDAALLQSLVSFVDGGLEKRIFGHGRLRTMELLTSQALSKRNGTAGAEVAARA